MYDIFVQEFQQWDIPMFWYMHHEQFIILNRGLQTYNITYTNLISKSAAIPFQIIQANIRNARKKI